MAPSKHPWALGRPARDVWRESWQVLGPPLTRLLEHGEAERLRAGAFAGRRLGCSLSPIWSEKGGAAGIFAMFTHSACAVRRAKGGVLFTLAERLAASAGSAIGRAYARQRRNSWQPGQQVVMDLALNEIHEAIYLIDKKGQFVYVNDEAVRALGYTRGELLGMGVPDIDPDFPIERWRRLWKDASGGFPGASMPSTFETTHMTKDGHVFPVEIKTSLIEYGGINYALSLVRDITERKRAEQQRLAHVHFLETLDKINQAMQRACDLEIMLGDVLDVVLEVFDCDRAFLFHPCDPNAAVWRVPVERTRPEFPGVAACKTELSSDPEMRRALEAALAAPGPVIYAPDSQQPLPAAAGRFAVKTMMATAIYPKIGAPWFFGVHQCSRPREWTEEEAQFLHAIGRRLSDAVTSVLAGRDLRQSEARLKAAQGIAHLADWELDLDTGVLTSSDEMFRILELDPAQGPITMQTYKNATHPDDRGLVDHAYTQNIGRGEAREIVHRLLMKDGRTKYVQANWTVAYSDDGKPLRAAGTMLDITKRKEAETLMNGQAQVLELVASGAPLQQSLEAVIRLIEEHAPGVVGSILLVDEEGLHLRHGAAPSLPPEYCAAIDGLTIGPDAGSCGAAVYYGKEVCVDDIASNPLWSAFRDIALPHGLRACWSTPIFDTQKKALGTFAMYARRPESPSPEHLRLLDMASHIAAIAIGRHRIVEALRLSEERYRSMVVATSTIVWTTNAKGKVISDNPSWREFSGQTFEEIQGDGWLNAVHPDDRAGTIATWRRAVETHASFQAPNRVRRSDGQYRYVEVAGVPVLEEDGSVREWIGTCTDVTDRVLARKEAARYRKHLETEIVERQRAEAALFQAQKMEALGRLTGGVAHDFNNLLTAITGNLDLLRKKLPPDAPTQRYARNALAAVERAAGITSQLLAFSRSQRLVSQAVAVNRVVLGMMSMIRQTVGERIEIRLQLEPMLEAALADRHQLETALLNLVINARDAMPDGGVLTIETGNLDFKGPQDADSAPGRAAPGLTPGRYVALTVRDSGPGVEPSVAARIFEPFVTTKEVGKGTGLGLSMVYGFARQLGGGAGFVSEPGQGAAFTIYLPQTDVMAPSLQAPEAAQQARSGKGTILVVEDDPGVREVATAALSNFGYDIVEAGDAAEAIEILEERADIGMVFTDLVMPKGNGVDLAKEIRRRWPGLAILLTTGYTRTLAEAGLPAGLEVLMKPYRPAELAEKAALLLGGGLRTA
jgi:PAS domain S-box-containing protein